MSTVEQVMDVGCTDVEEEECIARLYPWMCRTNNLQAYQEYRTLESMCDAQKIAADVVNDAIKHHGGHLGAFHFMKR